MTNFAPAQSDLLLARLKAVADEKRLVILELLAQGERCVCELQESLEVGQSLLSFHLKVLREAELVRHRREGRWVHYSLAPGGLEAVAGSLKELAREARTAPAGASSPRCD